MNTIYGRILFLFILTIFGSCTIYEKLFDNPVDFKANEWLTKTFKSGGYEDVDGLCKVASMNDIIKKSA